MKFFERVAHVYTESHKFRTKTDDTLVEIRFRKEGVEVKYCPELHPSYEGKKIERYFFPINEIKEIKYFDKPYLS